MPRQLTDHDLFGHQLESTSRSDQTRLASVLVALPTTPAAALLLAIIQTRKAQHRNQDLGKHVVSEPNKQWMRRSFKRRSLTHSLDTYFVTSSHVLERHTLRFCRVTEKRFTVWSFVAQPYRRAPPGQAAAWGHPGVETRDRSGRSYLTAAKQAV